jgi:uncharacterized protein with ParB-like and HNH nuclease domain
MVINQTYLDLTRRIKYDNSEVLSKSTSHSNLINLGSSGEIAIPEIQRPFVWSSTQVQDLIDSLVSQNAPSPVD